ncbi:hypothetical protein LCGC14_1261510 [marine sediment metagenome]|uniref:Uncharacterized protein n=1 Tax=marine sediment metagenome TaxID=412755 RepID=A0A0F9P3W4_9ZZZZ
MKEGTPIPRAVNLPLMSRGNPDRTVVCCLRIDREKPGIFIATTLLTAYNLPYTHVGVNISLAHGFLAHFHKEVVGPIIILAAIPAVLPPIHL